MDSRTARRTAEKAARDLITSRAALIGELGVAAAERTQLIDDITAATDQGRQLVAAAEAEATRLVAAAQDLTAVGDQRYTDAHTAATAAGWTPADLTALGFPPVQPPTRRRRTTSTRPAAHKDADEDEDEPAPQPTTVTVPAQAATAAWTHQRPDTPRRADNRPTTTPRYGCRTADLGSFVRRRAGPAHAALPAPRSAPEAGQRP